MQYVPPIAEFTAARVLLFGFDGMRPMVAKLEGGVKVTRVVVCRPV